MSQAHLILHVFSDRSEDAERLDDASHSLRDDLLDVDGVSAITPVARGPAAEGTKSIMPVDLGSLSVSVVVTGAVTAKIAQIIHDWLRRNDGKRVVVERRDGTEVAVEGYSEDAARQLIESVLLADG
jgi:hypothetical protein